jgi:hypothetical protein
MRKPEYQPGQANKRRANHQDQQHGQNGYELLTAHQFAVAPMAIAGFEYLALHLPE